MKKTLHNYCHGMTVMIPIKELLLSVITSCMDDVYVTPRFS